MSTDTKLIERVRQLVEAENEGGAGGKGKADSILAQRFTHITRSSGKEEERDALLEAIANPSNSNIFRRLDEHGFWVQESEGLGVVRSLVTTSERSILDVISGRFRNMHIFEKQLESWMCIAWQVTKLG